MKWEKDQGSGRIYVAVLGAVLLLMVMPLQADIEVKDGRFTVRFSDLESDENSVVELQRTYNSRSQHMGWFGPGWGSNFESYIEFSEGGVAQVHVNGNGRVRIYRPPQLSQESIYRQVNEMIVAADLRRQFIDLLDREQSRAHLLASATQRDWWWDYYHIRLEGAGPMVPVDTKYRSYCGCSDYLLRTAQGFERNYCDTRELYDNQGRLYRITDTESGNWAEVERDKGGRVVAIYSSEGDGLTLTYNSDGVVESVTQGEMGGSDYHYSGGLLKESTAFGGERHRYQYGNHGLLTKIRYPDESVQEVSYQSKEGHLDSLVDRSGRVSRYTYGELANGNGQYMEELGESGDVRRHEYEYSAYEYSAGEVAQPAYIEWVRLTDHGVTRETHYNREQFPLLITEGNRYAAFSYDDRNRLSRKETPYQVTLINYHPRFNKISEIMTHPPGEVERGSLTDYSYNEAGHLSKVVSNGGQQIELFYNAENQIVRTVSDDQVLAIVYNDIGKPSEIAVEGLGKVLIDYDEQGEISGVDSAGSGHRLAIMITRAFQQLLTLVKPAAVDFKL